METYKVTYTNAIGKKATINVKAQDEEHALKVAKYHCFTGDNFRDAVLTDEPYIHPKDQRDLW